MKIYIIQGSTGEYSDHKEWVVCALRDKQKAQEFIHQLVQEANTILSKFKNKNEWRRSNDWHPEVPSNDPQFAVDYTGFNYNLIETELRD